MAETATVSAPPPGYAQWLAQNPEPPDKINDPASWDAWEGTRYNLFPQWTQEWDADSAAEPDEYQPWISANPRPAEQPALDRWKTARNLAFPNWWHRWDEGEGVDYDTGHDFTFAGGLSDSERAEQEEWAWYDVDYVSPRDRPWADRGVIGASNSPAFEHFASESSSWFAHLGSYDAYVERARAAGGMVQPSQLIQPQLDAFMDKAVSTFSLLNAQGNGLADLLVTDVNSNEGTVVDVWAKIHYGVGIDGREAKAIRDWWLDVFVPAVANASDFGFTAIGEDGATGEEGEEVSSFAAKALTAAGSSIPVNLIGDDGSVSGGSVDLSLASSEQDLLIGNLTTLYGTYQSRLAIQNTTAHLYQQIDNISMEFELLDPVLDTLSSFVGDDIIDSIRALTGEGRSLSNALSQLAVPNNVSIGLLDTMREMDRLSDSLAVVGGVAADVLPGITRDLQVLTLQGVGLGQALAQLGLDPNLEGDLQLRIDQARSLDTLLGGIGKTTIPGYDGAVAGPDVLDTLRDELESLMDQGYTLRDAISLDALEMPSGLEAALAARIDQAENLGEILGNLVESVWVGPEGPIPSLDVLESDLRGLMDMGLSLQEALSSSALELPTDVRQNLIDRTEEATELHMILTGLGVPTQLQNQIFYASLDAESLKSALQGLQIDPNLRREIQWQKREVDALKISLQGIPGLFTAAADDLAVQLSLAWDDYDDLDEAIRSLGIGESYREQIRDHIELVTPLADAVSALKIDSDSFVDDLTKAFVEVGDLQGAVDSLDLTGFLADIRSAAATVEGDWITNTPGLADLIADMTDNDAIGLLKANLLTAYNEASALDTVLANFPTDISQDLRDDIESALALLSGGEIGIFKVEGLESVLADLQVPPDLLENIVTGYNNSLTLRTAMDKIGLPEGFKDDVDAAILAGDTLEVALADLGLYSTQALYGTGPDDIGLINELTLAFDEVEAFKTLLGQIEVNEALTNQISVLAGIIGGDEGLVKALESMGIDPAKAAEIGGARDTLAELMGILNDPNTKFPRALKDDIISSLVKGERLETVLANLSLYADVELPEGQTLQTLGEHLSASFDTATGLVNRLSSIGRLVEDLNRDDSVRQVLDDVSTSLTGIEGAFANIQTGAAAAKAAVEETTTAVTEMGEEAERVTENVTQSTEEVQQALDEINEQLKEMAQDTWVPSAELEKLLTRPELVQLEEAVRNEIRDVLEALEYDPTEYKKAQTDIINNRFHQSALSLARQFGIDVSGLQSGQAQSHFEILESERLDQLYQLDVDVQDKMDEMWLSALDSLTTTLGTVAGAQIDKDKLWETIRQFDSDLELRLKAWGLDEKTTLATIRKINNEIMNNTRRLSFEVATGWAAITGETGFGPGELDLSELGFDPEIFKITEALAEEFPDFGPFIGSVPSNWDISQFIEIFPDKVEAVSSGFEAMTGNAPTDEQLLSILRGEMVAVDSMPTLAARQVGAELMLQHMERTSKYDAIASEYQLDFDKFEQAKVEADQQWAAVTLDVVGMLGLPEGHPITAQSFREAKNALDSFVNAIYYNDDLTPEQRETAIADFTAEVAERFADDPGYPDAVADFHRANDQFNQLYGDKQKQIAMAFNLEAENFITASRAVEMEESRMMATWGSILMSGEEPAAPGELVAWNGDGYGTSEGGEEKEGKPGGHLKGQLYGAVDDEGITEYSVGFKRLRRSIINVLVEGMTNDPAYADDVAAHTTEGVVDENALQSLFIDKFFGPKQPATKRSDDLISYFYGITTGEDIRDIQADIEHLVGGNWTFTDDQLRSTLGSLLWHMSGSGNTQTFDVRVYSDLDPTTDPQPLREWRITATNRNWWDALDAAEQTAVMSIISNSTFSPERGQKGSFLSSIGEILGKAGQVALGAWAASKVSGGGGGGNTYNYYTEE